MKISIIIPARYASTRFPGKPLALIQGKPMIQRAYETALKVEDVDSVFVATDDQRIVDCVNSFEGKSILTGSFNCGSDRVQWASEQIDSDLIVNVQGDEPLISVSMINSVIGAFRDEEVVMATLKKKITNKDELSNPNVVKVITDRFDNALYFSRYPIPFNRNGNPNVAYYKHIGIYAYKKAFLAEFVKMKQTPLELSESLEQLRTIENGFKIKVIETEEDTLGVDTPEQLNVINDMMKERK
jgi:3-deoxy-manno-octulosonate cytidylyltransferase (CMP-KDO synthetase)